MARTDKRVQLRRRLSHNTNSNRRQVIKTPGGKLTVKYVGKRGKGVSCGGCGTKIFGIPQLRPYEYSRLGNRKKTVNRAYGGNTCHRCVREKILRAFLIEEKKIVKRVLKEGKKSNAASKSKK